VPLTECVEFKTVLQRGDRVQVPKLVRWEYKLEGTPNVESFCLGNRHNRWVGNFLFAKWTRADV